MKKTQLAEIKKSDIAALQIQAKELQKELNGLHLDRKVSKLSNLRAVKNKRKDLSQILTVLRQKQLVKELEETNG